ncbi:hypothetical protein M2222_006563 [Bradyrhizobium elkanii]|nr:hypothetical protein [Bradyrhizobium elkanii]MCS3564241.1 hypothetical protein [Bradyrhizobium elkanii]MCW2145927.1 hypothetical protein [Bradyrhizobium elkanii]MCW2355000.1 hypothetical protein [Bradyrhizobium elkanii]MCW2378754.1 hypothetical protein [Bradyrhizobium elkanii]
MTAPLSGSFPLKGGRWDGGQPRAPAFAERADPHPVCCATDLPFFKGR